MASKSADPEALGADIVDQLNLFVAAANARKGFLKLGKISEELCRHYRALAICVLNAEGDVDTFFHWLLHSPVTQKHYLVGVTTEGGGDPHYGRASFIDPVLDAIAARQWKLASAIGDLTCPVWLKGEEYEDDFCFGDFIRSLVAGKRDDLGALLERWREVLEGGRDPRLDVAVALHQKDDQAFAGALGAMLAAADRAARTTADSANDSLLADEYPFFPNWWISIPGLAFLALAEREGLTVEDEFLACPRLVRSGEYTPFRPKAYPMLGLD